MAILAQAERLTEPGGWPTREALEENLRDIRRVATSARHAAEDAVAEAASNVRRHPLGAVATTAAIAGIAGLLVGFSAGWFVRARR